MKLVIKFILSAALIIVSCFCSSYASESATQDALGNSSEYIVEYDGYSINKVSLYSFSARYFMLLDEFLKIFHIAQEQIDSEGSYRFRINGDTYIFYPSDKMFEKNRNSEKLNGFQYYEQDGKILIETSAIADIIGFDMIIDSGAGTMKIEKNKIFDDYNKYSKEGEGQNLTPEYITPLPAGSDEENQSIPGSLPAGESLSADEFNDLALKEKTEPIESLASGEGNKENEIYSDSGELQPEIQTHTRNPDYKLKQIDSKNINEDNLLVFEVRIGELSYDQLIDVYQHEPEENSPVYLSLSQLSEALDFPINISKKNKTAEGWFIKEDKTFKLDLENKTVEVEGKKEELKTGEVFFYNGDIFFIEDKLKEWFPIDYEINFSGQVIKLKPRVLLPFQEKQIREVNRNVQLKYTKKDNYEKIIPEYKLFQMPQADINLSVDSTGNFNGKNSTSAAYNALMTSELGYWTTDSYLSGNDKEVDSFRFQADKVDPNNDLYGSGVSSLSFGDISSIPVGLVSGSSLGRGVSVSTYPLSRPDEFAKKVIEGNVQPGWEVELYRNDQLVGFQTAGSDGRYKFEDVDVLYGENVFKLIFYGPQGEILEKTQKVFIDSNLLKKGQYNYRVSANQKGKNLVQTNSVQPHDLEKMVVQGEYGLTDKYTISSSMVSDEYLDKYNQVNQNIFQSFDFSTNFKGIFSNFNLATNYSNPGFAVKQTSVTNYKGSNINFSQIFYNDYENESLALNPDKPVWTSDITADRRFNFKYLKNLNTVFSIAPEVRESGDKALQITNRTSFVKEGLAFSNILALQKVTDTEDTVSGSISARAAHNKGFIRSDISYDLYNGEAIRNANLSYQSIFKDNIFYRFDVGQNFAGKEVTSFGISLSRDFKRFIGTVNSTVSNKGDYTIGVTIGLSLYQNIDDSLFFDSQSYSNMGNAEAFAYLDDNYDGTYDNNEKLIKTSKFNKGNKLVEEKPYKGKTFIRALSPNSFTDISFDASSLEDPLLNSEKQGYSLFSRPASRNKLSFPIIKTAEMDGTIYIKTPESKTKKPETKKDADKDKENKDDVEELGDEMLPQETVSGLNIFLLDEQGKRVATVTSEFDGYFLFEKVKPGKYFIVLDDKQLGSLSLKQLDKPKVLVNKDNDYYTDNNIYLQHQE